MLFVSGRSVDRWVASLPMGMEVGSSSSGRLAAIGVMGLRSATSSIGTGRAEGVFTMALEEGTRAMFATGMGADVTNARAFAIATKGRSLGLVGVAVGSGTQ